MNPPRISALPTTDFVFEILIANGNFHPVSKTGAIVHLFCNGDSFEGLNGRPTHCDFQSVVV
jgi:hypothetical protein